MRAPFPTGWAALNVRDHRWLSVARSVPGAKRPSTERDAYQWALSLDPLLPRSLWPADYLGAETSARHQTFLRTLRQRRLQLANS